jgi:hypothetical protein
MTAATVCSWAHLRTSVSQQSRADSTANVARYRNLFGARRRLELEREIVIREGVEQIVALALHQLRRLPVEADQHSRLAPPLAPSAARVQLNFSVSGSAIGLSASRR